MAVTISYICSCVGGCGSGCVHFIRSWVGVSTSYVAVCMCLLHSCVERVVCVAVCMCTCERCLCVCWLILYKGPAVRM